MKKIFNFFFLAMIFLPGIVTAQTKTLTINSKASNIEWTGKKVLGAHNGTVGLSSGKLLVQGSTLVGGEFTIDMNSIAVSDLKDPVYNQKLVGHLKNDDFFSVDKHGTALVKITKVEKYTTSGRYKVTADVTIKGITNPVTFDAELSQKGTKYTGTADLEIDRSKWDIRYGSSSFFEGLGDKAIKNEIELKVKIETI